MRGRHTLLIVEKTLMETKPREGERTDQLEFKLTSQQRGHSRGPVHFPHHHSRPFDPLADKCTKAYYSIILGTKIAWNKLCPTTLSLVLSGRFSF